MVHASSRPGALVALLLFPALVLAPLASATTPQGDGEIRRSPGSGLTTEDNVTVSYAWPSNMTSGGLVVQLRLGDVPIGNATAAYPSNGTSLLVVRTSVPSSVPAGSYNLSAHFQAGPGPFGEIYIDHDSVAVRYLRSDDQAPVLHRVDVAYEVGLGFVLDIFATDDDPSFPLSRDVSVTSALGSTAYRRPDGRWIHPAEPEELGTYELTVTVWDASGNGAGKRVDAAVVGLPVVVLERTIDVALGAHADVERIAIPARLLHGDIHIECTSGCGAGALAWAWDERPTTSCSQLPFLRFDACSFATPHAPTSGRLVSAQGPATFRIVISAIAV